MSKTVTSFLRVVREAPDKSLTPISDAVLDACLAQDKFSRVACETYVKSNIAIIGAKSRRRRIGFCEDRADAIRENRYVKRRRCFSRGQSFINVIVTQQSPTSRKA